MILLINICKEKIHYFEFVKPVEDILNEIKCVFFVKNYKEVSEDDLKVCSKIIICGTSLKDNDFINNLKYFFWIKDFSKPLLGICGGMQVIGKVFKGEMLKKKEIGFYQENFKNFLGLRGNQEVYHLHNYFIDFNKLKDFKIYSDSEIPQAIKHKKKPIYGVLFHPEVRQKKLILNFLNKK
jgi:GMP synthase (glutamine-hydrolysing)